jgi:voltage-gated potassium channel
VSEKENKRKIIIALALMFILIAIGTIGFMIIEGDDFLNSLYMTIITISTVGFREIHKLTTSGMIFTIVLIVLSISIYAFAITIITNYLIESQLTIFIRGNRSKKKRKMENHVVICGYGRNGQQAVRELAAHGQEYVVIDRSHDLILKNLDSTHRFLEGDATQEDLLEKASIHKARALITTLPDDAENLYVVLTARSLNPNLVIISRATDVSSEKKLKIAGANNVVMPEKVGGSHMATIVARPDVMEFLQHLSIHGDEPTNLEEILCTSALEGTKNNTILSMGIRKHSGVNIIGLKNPKGDLILNPPPDTPLIPGSKLFVLATNEQMIKLKSLLQTNNPG